VVRAECRPPEGHWKTEFPATEDCPEAEQQKTIDKILSLKVKDDKKSEDDKKSDKDKKE
jgi:hypothetical protein